MSKADYLHQLMLFLAAIVIGGFAVAGLFFMLFMLST